jgi:hypothetical protein
MSVASHVDPFPTGPSLIVKGYFAAPLDEALDEYKAAVARARYKNLKTEHDPHDAEINFKGGGRTGQIALRDTCKEAKTTYVQITARPTAAATIPAWFDELQSAATDFERETAFKDKDGANSALAELKNMYNENRAKLAVKAPVETAEIKKWLTNATAELKKGDLAGAHTFAKNILKELADAKAKLVRVPSLTGLDKVMSDLTAAAHDLNQEASFEDKPGTKRALTRFEKLFDAGKAKIEAKSEGAAELIDVALDAVKAEVANGDTEGTKRATKALVAAVAKAKALVG